MTHGNFQTPTLETALDTAADIARGDLVYQGALVPTYLLTFSAMTVPVRAEGESGDCERDSLLDFVRAVTLGFRPDAVAFVRQAPVAGRDAVVVSAETPRASGQRSYPLSGVGKGMRMARTPLQDVSGPAEALGVYRTDAVSERESADARLRVEGGLDPQIREHLHRRVKSAARD